MRLNDDPNTVEVLIKKGAKVNVKDNEGNTPLFLAVSCENYEIVESLLNSGADPNIFCLLGKDLYVETSELQNIKCTPLHLAAFIGNFDLINLLIEHGADIDAVCKNKKYSCLHMAVLGVTCYYDEGISEEKEKEYLEVVDAIISKFPDQINAQDHEDNSPLHRAVNTEHKDTIGILLDHGASLQKFRKGGYTPFHDAVSTGSLALVKLLLESSDEREKVINAVYRPVEENGDDICFQFSPLHYAVEDIKEDQSALILINELLTAKDVNPFIRDCSGKTPFYYAKEGNRSKILQALINNKYRSDKDSLLHVAVSNGNSEAVDYLIEDQKFDINLQNDSEITPLQLAASKGFIDVVRVLIKNGAKLREEDDRRTNAIQLAALQGHLDIVKLSLESFSKRKQYLINDCFTKLFITAFESIPAQIEEYSDYLKDNPYDELTLNNINDAQNTIERLIAVTGYFIDFYPELDINTILDDQKRTILHYVIKSKLNIHSKIELIGTLLKRKDINPFVKDAENKTPIDYYIEQKKYSHPVLDKYAKIQADRNTEIKNHKVKKYKACALTLLAANSIFIGIRYTLGSLTQCLSLMIMINVAVLACCLIIGKCIEKSIEEKYKNRVSSLFEEVEIIPLSMNQSKIY